MDPARIEARRRRLRAPRAAAVAGIVYAVFYASSQVILRLALPTGDADRGAALAQKSGWVSLALNLVPFAGIAFLWFMGVIRDRLGESEDQFLATVFIGGGLLYLAMSFISSAIAGGLLATYANDPEIVSDPIFPYSQSVIYQASNVYALRMSGVLMTSLASMLLRTGVMPRWVAFFTFVLALILLVSVSLSEWLKLVFPIWVFVLSVVMLTSGHLRAEPVSGAAGAT